MRNGGGAVSNAAGRPTFLAYAFQCSYAVFAAVGITKAKVRINRLESVEKGERPKHDTDLCEFCMELERIKESALHWQQKRLPKTLSK